MKYFFLNKLINKILFVSSKRYLANYLILIFIMLISAIFEAVGIGIILPFVGAISEADLILENKNVKYLLSFLDLEIKKNVIINVCGIALIISILIKQFFLYLSTYYQSNILLNNRSLIAKRILTHYLNVPYKFYLDKNLSSLLHLSAGVTTNFTTGYLSAFLMAISETINCTLLILLLFLINFKMSICLFMLIFIFGLIYFLSTKMQTLRLGKKHNAILIKTNKYLIEGLSSMKETRVYDASKYFVDRFINLNNEFRKTGVKSTIFSNLPKWAIETTFIVFIILTILLLSNIGYDLKSSIPIFSVFILAFLRILPSYNRILSSITSMRLNESSLNLLHEELIQIEKTKKFKSVPNTKVQSFIKNITLDNVSFSYPKTQKKILKNISFKINKGEKVALIGKTGSGKTTLVDIILGLLEANEGSVNIDKTKIINYKTLNGIVSYVPQDIFLMDDTLKHNICFGVNPKLINEKKLKESIKLACIHDLIKSLPNGINTKIGDKGIKLSGGQKQRIGIARALYKSPQILILDEATSSLDIETEKNINESLEKLSKKLTILIVAHRLNTIKNCDNIFIIENGSIVGSGKYKEIVKSNLWFKKINKFLK